MKKIFLLLALLVSSRVFSQTNPTTTPPVNPVQLNTNSFWWEPSTRKHFGYNGTTYLWWQPTDSIQVARMIARGSGGPGFIQNQTAIRQLASFSINGAAGANYHTSYNPDGYGRYRATLNPNGLSFGSDDTFGFSMLANDTTVELSSSGYPIKVVSGNPFRVEDAPIVGTDVVRLQDIGGSVITPNGFIQNQLSAPQTGSNFWLDGEGIIGSANTHTELLPSVTNLYDTSFGTYNVSSPTGLSIKRISDNVELFGVTTTLGDTTRIQGLKPVKFQNKVYVNDAPTEPKQVVRLQELSGYATLAGNNMFTSTNTFPTINIGDVSTGIHATLNASAESYSLSLSKRNGYKINGILGSPIAYFNDGNGAADNPNIEFFVPSKLLNTTITGVSGNGYLEIPSQSASPASSTGHLRIYADSLNRLSWKNSTYRRTIRVNRASDQTIQMPYRLNPIVADSTDVANAINNFSSATNTFNNIRVAAFGDSQTRGTGATAPAVTGWVGDLGFSTNYIYYNGGNNGEVSAQIVARLIADTARLHQKIILWAGRNDVTTGVPTTTTRAIIASGVAAIPHKNYVVMGVLYKQSEIIGTAARDTVTLLNNATAAANVGHYYDPNPIFINSYNPSLPQDVIDHANGVPPTSLMNVDGVHPNDAGYAVLAVDTKAKLIPLLSTERKYLSPENVATVLDSPPPIGNSNPNTGNFSYVTSTENLAGALTTTPLLNLTKNSTYAPASGSMFNIVQQTTVNSTQSGGAGFLYNVAQRVDVTGSGVAGGNIAYLTPASIVLSSGVGTTGWNNRLFVGGTSQFGVEATTNGTMTVTGSISINRGTSNTSQLLVSNSNTTGNAFIDIGNTATSGITWRARVGGNTTNSGGGAGVNEGNFALYENTANKIALHIMKTSTNIGIHGITGATSYFQIPAGVAAAGGSQFKLNSGVSAQTALEQGAFNWDGTNLHVASTATPVDQTFAYLNSPSFITPNLGVATATSVAITGPRVGTATLVAGTVAISITGITTSSKAFVTRTVASNTTLTTGLTAVCTAGTLTITADVAAGTINTADTSTYNYQVIN